ncbi:hypothetical protein SAMN04515666_101340 [Bosea lupini]|uniref:DUF6874 domain-containing protein n=2 Tax=Bosea lupini TaxID=1036779 RepID=A0A1H7GF81_9HYPH|nr:hypothetical protein SAMN04515666_101340 [Bosea lupini]
MNAVSFEIAPELRPFVDQILDRTAALYASARQPFDRLHHEMNLCACHANGCPLDFTRMVGADDFNLAHDVFGIDRHLDRDTGRLTDHFLPRFAKRQD